MTIIMAAFFELMAKSRVYLGAHTLNEVLHGSLIGITLAMIGHFKVKPYVVRIPEMLFSDE